VYFLRRATIGEEMSSWAMHCSVSYLSAVCVISAGFFIQALTIPSMLRITADSLSSRTSPRTASPLSSTTPAVAVEVAVEEAEGGREGKTETDSVHPPLTSAAAAAVVVVVIASGI